MIPARVTDASSSTARLAMCATLVAVSKFKNCASSALSCRPMLGSLPIRARDES